MDRSIFCPVKYIEHRKQTTMVVRSPSADAAGKTKTLKMNVARPGVVRTSVTNAEATDSSSDEEDAFCGRRRVKKFVNEVTIKPCLKESRNGNGSYKNRLGGTMTNRRKKSARKLQAPSRMLKVNSGKKFQRPWENGRRRLEIRCDVYGCGWVLTTQQKKQLWFMTTRQFNCEDLLRSPTSPLLGENRRNAARNQASFDVL